MILESHTIDAVKKMATEGTPYLIEGLLPLQSVNVIVGDSGLGKTPLLIQLGLCVANSHPFLGMKICAPGPVLYVDYENNCNVVYESVSKICKHLGLTENENFRWMTCPANSTIVSNEIIALKPKLVIIDALRGFDPSAEKDNTSAGARMNYFKQLSNKYKTSFLILHHTKKANPEFPTPSLINVPNILDWLEQASGARALINQSDTRIAVEDGNGDTDLFLRWYFKSRGDNGTWHVRRVMDEDTGDPIAYERITGLELIRLPQDRELLTKLPSTFRFKDLRALRKGSKSISRFLHTALAAGVLVKEGFLKDTIYHKS